MDARAILEPEMTATTAARLVRPLVKTFELPEDATSEILGQYGLSLADLEVPDARIEHDAMVGLLELAVRTTGNERLGLYGAVVHGPKMFHVLDYIGRTSLTIGESLEKFGRYQRLLHDGVSLRVVPYEKHVVVAIDLDKKLRFPPVFAEFCMGCLFVAGRNMGLRPDEQAGGVYFQHPEPADTAEHRALFAVPVHFGAKENYAVFSRSVLDREPVEADPVLCALLERHADQLLKRLPRTKPLSERVRKLVAAELRGGKPSETRIAEQLKMNPRTLRRRLEQDGTRFQDLLDELRRDLAMAYLREEDFEAEESAFLLGFSEASAFRRAVKRWTGLSVPEYRRQLRK